MQNNRNKQKIWQDIRPVQKPIQQIVKKPTLTTKIKTGLALLIKSPIIKTARIKLLKIRRKKIVITLIVILIAISYGSYHILKPHTTKKTVSSQTTVSQNLVRGIPQYTTIVPADKTITSLGGWTRVSPSSSDPVYAYTDKIGNVSVIVSEQPLPTSLKNDTTNEIEQMAQNFNASEKITIGSTTVYIGTSAEGPQSVIFTKNTLLVLIKSDSKIENDLWAKYINSLQ